MTVTSGLHAQAERTEKQAEKRELHPVEAQTKIRSRSQVMLLNLGGAGFSIRRDTSVTQKGRGLTAGEGGFHKENYNGKWFHGSNLLGSAVIPY